MGQWAGPGSGTWKIVTGTDGIGEWDRDRKWQLVRSGRGGAEKWDRSREDQGLRL